MRKGSRSTRGAYLLPTLLSLAACAGPPVKAGDAHHERDPARAGMVLVLHGSRAGSTAEVAEFIGKRLSQSGWSVDVEAVDKAPSLDGYRAVVIGSAIRRGNVLPEIRDFVKARRAELQGVPVAYFVVCMALREDTPENRAKASAYLDPLRSEVVPVEVGLFAGKMDYAKLDVGSRLMAKMVNIPAGDFRDWGAIAAWADALAARLGTAGPAALPAAR